MENLIKKNEKYDVEFRINRQNDGALIDIRSLAESDISEKKVYGMIFDNSKQKKVEQVFYSLLIIVSTILNLSTAFTAWVMFAGIIIVSPVLSMKVSPPIITSPLPSTT